MGWFRIIGIRGGGRYDGVIFADGGFNQADQMLKSLQDLAC